MGGYLGLLGSLASNLVRRVGEDLADCVAVCRRGVVYKLRSIRLRYDDVGPSSINAENLDWQPPPGQLAALIASVQNKPWFCELDRKTAQEVVHDGGPGCFLIRPSVSTKSLTLTLWYRHRAYNILIRQREDGLLALGSKKNQEMTFSSVDEMVRYYEMEPLILYSGGELTGRTRLKAPPPGLGRGNSKSSDHTEIGGRRSSEEATSRLDSANSKASKKIRTTTALRTLSSGHVEIPFNSLFRSSSRLAVSAPNIEHSSEFTLNCVFLEKDETPPAIPPKLTDVRNSKHLIESQRRKSPEGDKVLTNTVVLPPLPRRPLSTLPLGQAKSGLSVAKSLHNLTA